MARKSVTIECADCGTKYTITSVSPEEAQYCPFCSAECSTPIDDVDEGEGEDWNEFPSDDDTEESLDDE